MSTRTDRCAADHQVRCVRLEKEHVHNVYDRTAHHFKDVHYKAWPKVQHFLQQLEPGAVVADIGCGSGRYLNINPDIYKLGSDHSQGLAEIAHNNGHEVMVCDNLRLPYRDNCFDAIISIAVIHHFSTTNRRVQALTELARVLRPGGKIMIYVWAMEQKKRQFSCQDVLVPWHFKPKKDTDDWERKAKRQNIEHNGFHPTLSQGSSASHFSKQHRMNTSKAGGSLDSHPLISDSSQNPVLPLPMKFPWHSTSKPPENNKTGSLPDLSQSLAPPLTRIRLSKLTQLKQRDAENPNGIKGFLKLPFQKLFNNAKTPPSSPTLHNKNHYEKCALANFDDLKDKATGKLKDHVYKKLIEQIMREDQEIFRLHRPLLEHSISAPEEPQEGFAVRQFPESSRPDLRKQYSLDSQREAQRNNETTKQQRSLTEDSQLYPQTLRSKFSSQKAEESTGDRNGWFVGDPDNDTTDLWGTDQCDSLSSDSSSLDSDDDHWAETTALAIKRMQSQLDMIGCDSSKGDIDSHMMNGDFSVPKKCKEVQESHCTSPVEVTVAVTDRPPLSTSSSDITTDSSSDDDADYDADYDADDAAVAAAADDDDNNVFHLSSLSSTNTEVVKDGRKYAYNGANSTRLIKHASRNNPQTTIPNNITGTLSHNGHIAQDSRSVPETDGIDHTSRRFYHVFKEGELVELIEKHVGCLHILQSFYDHANWCVIAEKVNVWTI